MSEFPVSDLLVQLPDGTKAQKSGNYIQNDSGVWVPVSSADPMPVKGDVTLSGSNVLTGQVQTVASAGTAVQMPDTACREVTVTALKANTGSVYIGGSDVSSAIFGIELFANESFTFAVENTNLIYLDVDVSGEGVSYVAV